jgi:hypothetical protein
MTKFKLNFLKLELSKLCVITQPISPRYLTIFCNKTMGTESGCKKKKFSRQNSHIYVRLCSLNQNLKNTVL